MAWPEVCANFLKPLPDKSRRDLAGRSAAPEYLNFIVFCYFMVCGFGFQAG
jgi:hypothetical protein